MKWLLATIVVLLPSMAFAQLSDEDIAAITDSITVRALEIQALEADDANHAEMQLKLDKILLNQAGFQALVKLYIDQDMRKAAIRTVLRERDSFNAIRNASASSNSCGGGRGRFRFFGMARF